jgi:aminoglycoside 3-N-acetyltransferase
MIGYREITSGLRQLGLDPAVPVIVHASLSAFGDVRGGTGTLLGALLASQSAVMMPAFTYKTMLTPEDGPLDNGIDYGQARSQNLMAEFFKPDMPADPSLGFLPEILRVRLESRRSSHPILSFTGVNVEDLLAVQTLADPLAPIGALARRGGWVLLVGVNHTVNTSLHYAERLANRPQFTRWALTYDGVRECPGFPGCSYGFEKATPWLDDVTRRVQIGSAQVRAVPLTAMFERICAAIQQDPQVFLCDQPDCELCSAVRRRIQPAVGGVDGF